MFHARNKHNHKINMIFQFVKFVNLMLINSLMDI